VGDLAVEIDELVVTYGHGRNAVTAVDKLSLAVERATVTAILGPNGAGKTTTISACEGYLKPQHGRIFVLGLNPLADHRRLAARVGVMPQEGGAWSGVRAEELLRHFARLYAAPLDVDMLVERLGLGQCGRTPYRRLSGGEKQRLGLACAIVGRPELVFLDEPTAGLDPQARHATWSLVRDLRRDGVTVVLTTHYMEEAEQLSDYVYVVDRGSVIAAGSPAELTERGAENTLRFKGPAGLDVRSLAVALPESCRVRESSPGNYLVVGTIDPQLLATVTAWCASYGVMPDGLAVERHTLEDVFLELTGRELRS
jgi:ABC-2 type transport system ATP-binding protein